MTNAEIHFMLDAIEWTASHYPTWMGDYTYDPKANDYSFRGIETKEQRQIDN